MPWFQFNGGRTNNAGQYQTDRGPFTNENVTNDVIANLTKVWGAHASKAGFYFQHSFKPQSIFASFNSTINFKDNGQNPFDTGYSYANAALGVFNSYTQANKYAVPEWNYKNFEFYAQDNWKPNRRLTLDYGARFYYLTPQWDTTLQASNFLPDQFNQAAASKLYFPVCANGTTPANCDRRGIDPAFIGANGLPTVPATTSNTVEGRFIGRLIPGSNRFNGALQAGQGINDQLQSGNAFRVSPRVGVVYDLTGKGATIIRGGWGIFYDRPQGNQVFDMIANAPGRAELDAAVRPVADADGGGRRSHPTLSLNPSAYDFKPPRVEQWNIGIQHKLMESIILDLAYVGSNSTDLLRQVQINAVPFGAAFLPQNQDPTRVPSATPGATALPTDFLRPFQGYSGIRMWDYSGYANYHALQTSREPPVRPRVHVLGLLGVEQGARHQQHGLLRGRAEPDPGADESARLLAARLRPSAQHHAQRDLPDASVRPEQGARLLAERLADLGRVPLDERPALHRRLQIPGIGAANLTGDRRQPERAHRR